MASLFFHPTYAAPFSCTTAKTSAALDASKLVVQATGQPKSKEPLENLVFGHTFTDHMLVCEWDQEAGWHAPTIQPYQPLSLDPSCVVFHYGLEVRSIVHVVDGGVFVV